MKSLSYYTDMITIYKGLYKDNYNAIERWLENELYNDLSLELVGVKDFKTFNIEISKVIHIITHCGLPKECNRCKVWTILYNSKILPTINKHFTDKVYFYCGVINILYNNDKTVNSSEKIQSSNYNNPYKEELIFMELKVNYTKEELISNYRRLALKYHPDKGGSDELMFKLNKYKITLERLLK